MITVDTGFQIRLLREELSELKNQLEGMNHLHKPIMTSEEAANYAGIKKSYLDKLCSIGKLSYYQPRGKMKYFKREDLDAWLLRNKRTSVDEHFNNYY